MTKGPFLGKIIYFALPLALTGILQLLYNAADIVVVGRFADSQSLAAVGSTSSLINLIINLFIGLSVGTSVAAARYFGANEKEKIEKVVHTSIVLSLACGIAVGVFGIFMSRTMLILMGTPKDVLDLASLYLKIYFMGMPLNMVYTFGAAALRGVGDTKRPLYILTFAGIANVILNLIFVICFKWNVMGVALATVISQGISAVLILVWLSKEKGSCRFSFKKLKVHKKELFDIIKIGLPAGFQGTLFSISNVIIQSSINSFGSTVMAGSAAAANIEGFVYISMNALHHAALTFTGQNYGARKPENFNRILWGCLFAVTVTGLIMGMSAWIFGRQLLFIYTPEEEVIGYGLLRIGVICTTYFLCGIMDVLVGQIRGLGYSVVPMVISIFGVCVLRIVWIFTVFAEMRTQEVLYSSYPVSWFTALSILLISYFIIKKRVELRFHILKHN